MLLLMAISLITTNFHSFHQPSMDVGGGDWMSMDSSIYQYDPFINNNIEAYEEFPQVEKNDFNSNYKFTYSKKELSALTILRGLKLITIGVS